MRYLLGLPKMETKQKMDRVKAYLNAMQNPKNPLHDAVTEEKGCRLATGKSCTHQAERPVMCAISQSSSKQIDW